VWTDKVQLQLLEEMPMKLCDKLIKELSKVPDKKLSKSL
jgi:hypothetical protein